MEVTFGKRFWLIGLVTVSALLLQHDAVAQVADNASRTGNELQRANRMRQRIRDMQQKMGEMERKINSSMSSIQSMQTMQPKIKMRNLNPTFNNSFQPRRRMKIRGLMD